jgi:hypothetical protein
MIIRNRVLSLLIASHLWLCAAVSAQQNAPTLKKAQAAQNEILDLSVPESSGFTILGLTPQTVVRPASPRPFATSLLNGVDPHGNFQAGIAFDLAPYPLFAGARITLDQYRKSRRLRLLSNTQVSFAATKGVGDSDKAIRIGMGFQYTLFDKGDPRLYPGSARGSFFIDEQFDTVQGKLTELLEKAKGDKFGVLDFQRRQVDQISDPDPLIQATKRAVKTKQFRDENIVLDDSFRPKKNILDARIREDYALELKVEARYPNLSEADFVGANLVELRRRETDSALRAETWKLMVAEDDAMHALLNKQITEQQALVGKETQVYQTQLRKLTWNRSSWIIAGAPSWISPDGSTHKLQLNGGGIWTSYAYGFEGVAGLEKTSQLIFHLRYRLSEQVADPTNKGAFYQQNSFLAGVRLHIGSPDAIFNIESSFIHARPDRRGAEDYFRMAAGPELNIARDQWLSLSIGGEGGRRNASSQAFILAAFKYGLSGRP